MDAGAAPVCSTDGAVPRACTTDADCEGAPHLGAGPLVCNASRVCDCAPPPSRSAGGCAIGARHAAPGSPWALGAVLALRRRRRRT
ncbi:MAG: hypothetical protein IT378_24715 [Sandaracinaceae bacterium]|nr:hypothetical protein [Sandaracinaceae bacterium]